MKRDIDLIRKIMLEIEKYPSNGEWIKLSIPGYSEEEISFHVMLLSQDGLVEAINAISLGAGRDHDYIPIRFTNSGFDFLEVIKNDTVWNRAKEKIAQTTGTLSISVLKAVVTDIATRLVLGNYS